MENKNLLKQPLPNELYGAWIYWVSIVAAVICIVAPVIALAFPSQNVLDPQFLFSTIWEGAKPLEVWETAGTGFPGGHFWINNLTKGDGLIQLGIVLGGICAGFGLIGAAIGYLKEKPRSIGWAIVSVVICLFIALSALGVYTQAE